ncbi:MAG: IS66 family transposase [Casimicrobiaceae bacterium]
MFTAATDPHTLTDIEALRRLVLVQRSEHAQQIAEHQRIVAERDRAIVYKETKIAALTHELARYKRWLFAARSEKMDPAQRALFEEAVAENLAAIETELESLRSTPAPKAKPKREALPAHLPRIETRLEPESCQCAACGAALTHIGDEVNEQLDCKPIEFFVRRTVRGKYACRSCETITTAPLPAAIIERGQPAPGLLAQVLVAKYADHEPLYRQSEIYRRSGVEIARSTLADWVGASGVALMPLAASMKAELLNQAVLHADETPIAQLEPGSGKTHRAYLFAYRSAGDTDITVFDYCQSRSGEHARNFLGDWRGALMVDDFGGYKALFPKNTELACWAHARRKFHELVQSQASTRAHEVLPIIAELYRIEDHIKDLDPPTRTEYRQRHARPVLDRIREWIESLRPQVLGNSGLARAINYTHKRWAALTRYLDDPRYPIDNNKCENAIRPIALGRKNYLFVGSERAGLRAAAIMSLIATAKHNGHDPHAYLKDVLTRLPTTKDRDIADLLPHRWQPIA